MCVCVPVGTSMLMHMLIFTFVFVFMNGKQTPKKQLHKKRFLTCEGHDVYVYYFKCLRARVCVCNVY